MYANASSVGASNTERLASIRPLSAGEQPSAVRRRYSVFVRLIRHPRQQTARQSPHLHRNRAMYAGMWTVTFFVQIASLIEKLLKITVEYYSKSVRKTQGKNVKFSIKLKNRNKKRADAAVRQSVYRYFLMIERIFSICSLVTPQSSRNACTLSASVPPGAYVSSVSRNAA